MYFTSVYMCVYVYANQLIFLFCFRYVQETRSQPTNRLVCNGALVYSPFIRKSFK